MNVPSAHPARPRRLGRRGFLQAGCVTLATTAAAAACSTGDPPAPSPSTGASEDSPASARRVLLAYFSRAGENYHYGGRRNLAVGNTQVVAQLISHRLTVDTFRIEAADA